MNKYDILAFDEAVAIWQKNTSGSECSTCYGHNMFTLCSSCGFWGLVDPEDPSGERNTNQPKLEDFKIIS